MEEWRICAKKADFKALGAEFNIDPVVARVIRNKDYITDDDYRMYLFGDMSCLHNAKQLRGCDEGVKYLLQALDSKEAVRIVGDYDIDGICSVVILYKALKELGFEVSYDVPDRIKDGYGINKRIVTKAYEDGCKLIITCDNGIAASDEIQYAKDLGMKVIVTDHHEVPISDVSGDLKEVLPNADVIIDPKQEACSYPFKGICGAVVAFKLICRLYEELGRDYPSCLVEYAAIATIGDIMELRDENRILVKEGFRRIADSKELGLCTLIDVLGIDKTKLNSYDVGFRIGPCLNSSGRLRDAHMAIKMFLGDDSETIRHIANALTDLNDDRKDMTENGVKKAVDMIETSSLIDDDILVIYLSDVHESVAGIIAGRIKERYNKPVLVFTDSEDGLKGSGRSIEAYNMFEELSKVRELFTKFGGHPMAAGFSMPKDNLLPLRKRLNENSTLTEKDFIKKIWIDTKLPFGYLSMKLIEDLSLLEPFGNGNTRPVFAVSGAFVMDLRVVGKNANVTKVTLKDETGIAQGVYFGGSLEGEIKKGDTVDVLYYPAVNDYNNQKSIQIIINSIKVRN